MRRQQSPNASRIENGKEICNTCIRPVNQPFRYKYSQGRERGCVSTCHDLYIRRNVNPSWMSRTRYTLPKWVTEARRAIKAKHGVTL
jgi:hypothetical protein